MKKVLFTAMLSSALFVQVASGVENRDSEQIDKAEQVRLCNVYTDKIEKYKKVMRDDDLAKATLNNYKRLQKKYCNKK